MDLTFWLNILSPHIAPLLRDLTASCDVRVVTTMKMPQERLTLGWSEQSLHRVEWIRVASQVDVNRICSDQTSQHINVVGGFRGLPLAGLILKNLTDLRRRVGIITERPNTCGVAGYARHICSCYRARRYRSVDFVLAMGRVGERWFINSGWPAHKVFPFAYTASCLGAAAIRPQRMDRPFQILFVGQFIARKGGDILLQALASNAGLNWNCLFVGQGEQKKSWETLSSRLGISAQVSFRDPEKMERVWELMAESDMLVLPSRFDGWGVVVNEALMAGVPVVCSSACGSQDLLDGGIRGELFETGNRRQLAGILRRRIAAGPNDPTVRLEIQDWSRQIRSESAAAYFTEIMNHAYGTGPRPTEPWLCASAGESLRYA